jgi:hypothetical protein
MFLHYTIKIKYKNDMSYKIGIVCIIFLICIKSSVYGNTQKAVKWMGQVLDVMKSRQPAFYNYYQALPMPKKIEFLQDLKRQEHCTILKNGSFPLCSETDILNFLLNHRAKSL